MELNTKVIEIIKNTEEELLKMAKDMTEGLEESRININDIEQLMLRAYRACVNNTKMIASEILEKEGKKRSKRDI